MEVVTEFNSLRDIAETSQTGYVDLYELLGHGVVPANLNVAPESFNDIDDPKSIFGKPSDPFEAIHMAKVLNQRGADAQRLYNEREAAKQ